MIKPEDLLEHGGEKTKTSGSGIPWPAAHRCMAWRRAKLGRRSVLLIGSPAIEIYVVLGR